MARPRKTGLDYFPFDVGFFDDPKIAAVAGEFGLKGEAVAVKLLCDIYRNGYFLSWSDMQQMTMLNRLPGVSAQLLAQIVNRLVRWGFFDKSLFDSARVLTSRGIQRRYFEATRKRTADISALPYVLTLDSDDSDDRVSGAETPVSASETTVSRPKIPDKGVSASETPVSASETQVSASETPQIKVNINNNVDNAHARDLELASSRFHPSEAWLDEWLSRNAAVEQWCATRRISKLRLAQIAHEALADMMLFRTDGYPDKTEALRHLQGLINKKIVAGATSQNQQQNADQQPSSDPRLSRRAGSAAAPGRFSGPRTPPPPDCGLIR